MAGTRKLGRTSDQRRAMLRAMVTYLLENGKIESFSISPADVGLWSDETEAALRRVLEGVRRWSAMPIAIQLAPSLSLVEAGDSVTAGDRVTSDADGNAVTATFGTKVNGIAYTGGADGELITVKTVDPVDGAAVGGQIVDFGVATLVAGTKTVTNTKVASGDKILVSRVTPGGTVGNLSAPAASITAATSFVINSDSATETSTVAWAIVR